MSSLRPTGVEIVDLVLGGIAPGQPCVVAGPSGSGRTVLCLQLVHAALAAGRVVAFLCNEPAPFLLQQTATLDIDLDAPLRTGQLVLLELDAAVASAVRRCGLEPLVRAVRREEPIASTLIVDPFTALTPEIHDEARARRLTREFLDAALPMEIVLTAESERLAEQHGLERALSELCGAFLRLHRSESGRRTLTVEKTRSGVGFADRIDFRIGEGGTAPILPEAPPATDAPTRPEAVPPAEIARGAQPLPLPKERPLILVVDADDDARDQIATWLSGTYEVATANDGFEAMTMLVNEMPNLVILDLLMPRISGYELLTAFRRTLEVPRLVVSERVRRPGDRIGPLVLGATDTLAKPVERFELMHKVDLLLRLPGPGPNHMDPADAEELFGSISSSRVLDRATFDSRLNGACRFGERYGMPSSLVTLETASAADLERWVEVANEGLRFEDAIFHVSECRAVLLLVATDPDHAPRVVARIRERAEAAGVDAIHLASNVQPAEPVDESCDWQDLFRAGRDTADAAFR